MNNLISLGALAAATGDTTPIKLYVIIGVAALALIIVSTVLSVISSKKKRKK